MRNKRCGVLEVAPVSWIHVAFSFTHRISTAHMSSNENINISNRKNHVTGIYEYTCSNNGPYDKNIETIHACIPVNPCNSNIRT